MIKLQLFVFPLAQHPNQTIQAPGQARGLLELTCTTQAGQGVRAAKHWPPHHSQNEFPIRPLLTEPVIAPTSRAEELAVYL